MFGRMFQSIPTIRSDELHQRIQSGDELVIIDVREPHEHARGVIPGARRLPLGQLPHRHHELPKDAEIIVVCHSGARSHQATMYLHQQGFAKATNMTGGMMSWRGPVER